MRLLRLVILLSWLAYCYVSHGGMAGVFTGFVFFGLMAYAWYWITDSFKAAMSGLRGAVSRPNVTNQTLNLMVTPDDLKPAQARRGSPATTDDFAGMIEYRKHT